MHGESIASGLSVRDRFWLTDSPVMHRLTEALRVGGH